jgi:hypothetical protein
MYQCPDDKWCCEKDCDCDKGEGVHLENFEQLPASTPLSFASTSGSPSSTPSASQPTIPDPSDQGLYLRIGLGVGLGVGLTVLAMFVGGIWWFMVRRRTKRTRPTETAEPFEKAELYGETAKTERSVASGGLEHQGVYYELANGEPQNRQVSYAEIDGKERAVEVSDTGSYRHLSAS